MAAIITGVGASYYVFKLHSRLTGRGLRCTFLFVQKRYQKSPLKGYSPLRILDGSVFDRTSVTDDLSRSNRWLNGADEVKAGRLRCRRHTACGTRFGYTWDLSLQILGVSTRRLKDVKLCLCVDDRESKISFAFDTRRSLHW